MYLTVEYVFFLGVILSRVHEKFMLCNYFYTRQ
ncbi:MAG: hypothetical protein JWQ57_3207 [Mucilaginibacter sp.]|nr:hypothetical protein [Mucilaginibacter sp.]